MRSDLERFRDIADAIDKIERYINQGQKAFQDSELIQVWVVHYLQIIGEASRSLSPELIAQYPDVPWIDAIDLRNIVVHEYFRVDLSIVWDITQNDLPELKEQIEAILQQLER